MEKIKNSFSGVFLGIIFIIIGTVLLWWNEGNNVNNIKTTDELSRTVIDVSSDKIDASNEGKLIATNGDLKVVDESVIDKEFNVKVKTAKLVRLVEIYQWEEIEHTDDKGNTTYTYEKVWNKEIINSSGFDEAGHSNPTVKPYEKKIFTANTVKVGAFELSGAQIDGLETESTVEIEDDAKLPKGYKISANFITNSANLNNPKIGDVRISFMYNDYEDVSVLAVQRDNSFGDFQSKVEKSVNRVEEGKLTGAQMVSNLESENNMLKWMLRGGGLILLVVGYIALLNPIATLTSFIPILGSLVGGVLSLIGFLVGLVHSLIVISLAWIRFRPLVGIGLLAIAIVLIFFIRNIAKNKKESLETNN